MDLLRSEWCALACSPEGEQEGCKFGMNSNLGDYVRKLVLNYKYSGVFGSLESYPRP